MPVANATAPHDDDGSEVTASTVDKAKLDALAHRLSTADPSMVASFFEQLGAPAARQLGQEFRRRADRDPANRPLYERAVIELICADLACSGPVTGQPESAARGIEPAPAGPVESLE